jgi:hypothetical protein
MQASVDLVDREVQNTIQTQEAGVGSEVTFREQEAQVHVIGDSKEVQNVQVIQENQMQTEVLLEDKDVQASDFELITTKQHLNVLEFEKALQS